MKYSVETQDGITLGGFRSVIKAQQAVEQHFQCGTEETVAELRESLRLTGSAVVRHTMDHSTVCFIAGETP